MLFVHAPKGRATKPPMDIRGLRRAFPQVSFPVGSLEGADLSHLGLYPVPAVPVPGPPEDGMRWALDVPERRAGKWVRTFKQVPASS